MQAIMLQIFLEAIQTINHELRLCLQDYCIYPVVFICGEASTTTMAASSSTRRRASYATRRRDAKLETTYSSASINMRLLQTVVRASLQAWYGQEAGCDNSQCDSNDTQHTARVQLFFSIIATSFNILKHM